MKRLLVGFILLVLLIIPLHVRAGVPFDTVKGHVNEVLRVLRDPALQGEANEEAKQEKIEAIADEMFDYVALSRLTLRSKLAKIQQRPEKRIRPALPINFGKGLHGQNSLVHGREGDFW